MSKQYIARVPIQEFAEDRMIRNESLAVLMPFSVATRQRKVQFGWGLIVEVWRAKHPKLRKLAADMSSLRKLVDDETAIGFFDKYCQLYHGVIIERYADGVSIIHDNGMFHPDIIVSLNDDGNTIW